MSPQDLPLGEEQKLLEADVVQVFPQVPPRLLQSVRVTPTQGRRPFPPRGLPLFVQGQEQGIIVQPIVVLRYEVGQCPAVRNRRPFPEPVPGAAQGLALGPIGGEGLQPAALHEGFEGDEPRIPGVDRSGLIRRAVRLGGCHR